MSDYLNDNVSLTGFGIDPSGYKDNITEAEIPSDATTLKEESDDDNISAYTRTENPISDISTEIIDMPYKESKIVTVRKYTLKK